MADELELINDGEGVAIIGEAAAIERFLTAENLPSRELDVKRLGTSIGRISGAAQAGSEISAHSGRWVKLTEKSAEAFNRGTLMKGSEAGVSRAVLTKNGKIDGILEIVKPGAFLTNPAVLAGAAGIMAQIAMVGRFREVAGIEGDLQRDEARSWGEAFVDTRDKLLVRAGEGVGTTRRAGSEVFTQAKESTSKFSGGIADRVFRRTDDDDETEGHKT